MRFIKRFTNWFKDKNTLIDENMEIRKGKHKVEQKLNEMLETVDEIQSKYIAILEQKSEPIFQIQVHFFYIIILHHLDYM